MEKVKGKIIPGLIVTFLSELPHTANGSTLVRMFLAARSCLAPGDKLELRASNEISKMCNYLVRGLRHGLCSWISMNASKRFFRRRAVFRFY